MLYFLLWPLRGTGSLRNGHLSPNFKTPDLQCEKGKQCNRGIIPADLPTEELCSSFGCDCVFLGNDN